MPGTESAYHTGEQVDPESGFVYLRNRNLDPTSGSAQSSDPLGFLGYGVNLYAYLANHPTDGTDPAGLTCDLCDDLGFWNGEEPAGGDESASLYQSPVPIGPAIPEGDIGPSASGPEGKGFCASGGAEGSTAIRGGSGPLTAGPFEVAPRVVPQLSDPRLGALTDRFSVEDIANLAQEPGALRVYDTRTGNINVIQRSTVFTCELPSQMTGT